MRMGKSPGLKLQASVVQDNVPIEVAPGVFVGSIHAAFNVDVLKEKKITHVLNLAGAYATFPDVFTYLSISIRDKEYANLLSCLPICKLFLQAGINAGGVLVHCAGGRSRSPAVAISYLMTTDKLTFDAALTHVRALRPVVTLNAGFEHQLRCLERTRGDVLAAHQLHLASKLSALAQRHADGSLAVTKRRPLQHSTNNQSHPQEQHQQQRQHATNPGTPPKPSMSIRALQLERQASGCCDDRGMLDGTLPSGFSLSLPIAATHTHFIPALRSMGSMFGCRACGEHLFCASAVVHHSTTSDLQLSHCSSSSSVDDPTIAHCASPLRTSRKPKHDPWAFEDDDEPTGETDAEDTTDAVLRDALEAVRIEAQVVPLPASLLPLPSPSLAAKDVDMRVKKTPLLAKLRLRPQSPSVSVSSPPSSNKSTPRAAAATAAIATRAASPASRVGSNSPSGGVLKKSVVKSDVRSSDKDECANKLGAASASGIGSPAAGSGVDKLWRTLTALTATKRLFKDSPKHARNNTTSTNSASDDKKRANGASDALEDAAGDSPLLYDARYLHDNIAAWERGLCAIERASGDDTRTARKQVAALVAADAQALATLACDEWFIEPQRWFVDAMALSATGAIRCPNSDCSAVVGQWCWDGLSCSCGGRMCPGVQMKRSALQPLGSIVTQVRHAATRDVAPEDTDALYIRHSVG